MFCLLMTIFISIGLPYKKHYEIFYIYYTFCTMVKMQHYLVMECFRRDLGGEFTSKISHIYLHMMVLFIRHLVLILLNIMGLLKENFVILLRLSVPFCCQLQFLVSFEVNQFLLLFMLLIESHRPPYQVCLL